MGFEMPKIEKDNYGQDLNQAQIDDLKQQEEYHRKKAGEKPSEKISSEVESSQDLPDVLSGFKEIQEGAARSGVLGYMLAAEAPVTREAILDFEGSRSGKRMAEWAISDLIKKGWIEEVDGQYILANEYPGKGIIEHLKQSGDLKDTIEIAKSVIARNKK